MRIFWKQLLLHLGTLIISLVLLALVLTQGIQGFLTRQKVAELTILSQRAASVMEDFAVIGMWNYLRMQDEIQIIYRYTGAIVEIVTINFNSEFQIFDGITSWIDVADFAPVLDGETVAVFGTSPHPHLGSFLVVGYPVRSGAEPVGVALVGVSMVDLEHAIADMYRITIVALVGVGLFAFVLIYMSSRAISRPLRQVNEAASVIAAGDFEKRLPVGGTDEIGQLAVEFNRMAESLQQQERIRREFIANLSHDMRSPLTSMRGFLTAISDGTIPTEQQPRYLQIVMDESERLIKLSNNILDIYRVQDAEIAITKTEFDINDLIRTTILGFQQRALDKRIMVTSRFAHNSDIVLADEDKMRRVMHNLIDNALKFTPQGGEITVETTVNAISGKVAISVSDNGCGMTEEEQKRIFDRFYKGDQTRNEDKMGSGLGLSIVKEFVLAHGEVITVESEVGVGTRFEFWLELV